MKLSLFILTSAGLFACALKLSAGVLINPDTLSIVKSLEIGDQVPSKAFPVLNHDDAKLRLTNFKGKWLLLDFWNTHCAACVVAFPKVEQIQKGMKDSLSVLLVNSSEDDTKITPFLNKLKDVRGYQVPWPVVYGDSTLSKYFEHRYLPYYVLINPEGRITAKIRATEMDSANLNKLMKGEKTKLSMKDWEMIDFDRKKPLFVDGNAGNGENILWYSTLSKKVEGLPAGHQFMTDTSKSIVYAFNYPIRNLYQVAYYDGFKTSEEFEDPDNMGLRSAWLPNSRTILQVKDTSLYVSKVDGKYQQKNRYTYQLIAPKGIRYKELQQFMKEDLNRYFRLNAHFEKRKMNCLVLSCDNPVLLKKMSEKEGEITSLVWDRMGIKGNYDFSTFVMYLFYASNMLYGEPLFDETGIKGRYNFSFTANMEDYKSIDSALKKKYGIRLRKEEREVDVLVISENCNL